jgi:signal transduction histidine kinase
MLAVGPSPNRREDAACADAVEQARIAARRAAARQLGRMGVWDYERACARFTLDGELSELFGLELGPDAVLAFDALIALIHPEDRDTVQDVLATALQRGCGIDHRFRLTVPGQPERTVHSVGAPVCDPDGRLMGLSGMAQDVTVVHADAQQLIAARDTAEAASAAKSRFLATMGHELRTPLNAINGFSELILAHAAARSETVSVSRTYAEYAGYIRDSGRHLLSLIDGILDVTKLEAGEVRPVVERQRAPALIRSGADLLQGEARRRGVRLAFGALAPAVLETDPRLIRQAVVNLVSNAIKFSPEGGTVEVSGRAGRDGGYAVEVRDQGPGIPPEARERVRLAFVQADDRLARTHEGTGLGLYLVTSFLRLHGGRLELADAPGGGTLAAAVLPPACVEGA